MRCLVYLVETGYGRVRIARIAGAARGRSGHAADEDRRGRDGLGGGAPVACGPGVASIAGSALQDVPRLGGRHLRGVSVGAADQQGRAIGVINVHHRDRHEHSVEEISTIQFIGEQMGNAIAKSLLEEENARLSAETEEMKRQLETRKAVERAKGILQRRHNLTEEEAYLRMRNESRPSAAPDEGTRRRDHLGGGAGAQGFVVSGLNGGGSVRATAPLRSRFCYGTARE